MAVADFIQTRILENFSFEATECQLNLFHLLAEFSAQKNECDILVVNGYAGTGKTSAIAAFVKFLKGYNLPFKLMAPTGRAAKVLAGYTGEKAYTIHKQIYRQKSAVGALGVFTLDINKSLDTFYIVDEASLISIESAGSQFGSGDLLGDLISYIREGEGNKLILVGDNAQLPPIGLDKSPALSREYMSLFGTVWFSELSTVVRQAVKSGILHNATILRKLIEESSEGSVPKFEITGFEDIESLNGGELIETISDAVDKFGIEETTVLCRSNKRANRYNAGIRSTVLFREEQLNKGDRVMVVKNCYQFVDDIEELDFIANGDVAVIQRIRRYEERYGLHFAEATLMFPDYNDAEITAKIILDTLTSESASLSQEQQNLLYEGVFADYEDIPTKKKRNQAVREDKYYNALQIKHATAITCHKSQGGQWNCVFIDNPFWQDQISLDDLKWLYTAITRAVSKVYLVNFDKRFFV